MKTKSRGLWQGKGHGFLFISFNVTIQRNALDMSRAYDWKERPSARARAIANYYLIGELRTITGEETPDFRISFLNEGSP
eukprot:scaffold11427_cov231-Skeletonema_marinoi.AAC.9